MSSQSFVLIMQKVLREIQASLESNFFDIFEYIEK